MPTFLVLNAGAVLVAVLLAIASSAHARASRLAVVTLTGYLVTVHSLVLLTGLVGCLTRAGLILALVPAVAAAAWLARRRSVARAPETPPARASAATVFSLLAAGVAGAAWVWPHVIEATRLWVWDDYTYHAVYPALWLRQHVIAAPAPAQAFTMQAWYPLSASVVAAWFMVPLAETRAAALAWVSLTGPLYAGLAAAAGAELLARLGCPPWAWALPAVLFATSARTAIMAASFSDADLAQAAALFAALALSIPRGDTEDRRAVTADTWYAALLTGFALGVKVSAAPAALVVTLVLMARGGVTRVVLMTALAWSATGGYWYVRNLVHTGNPVYPAALLGWPGTAFPETTLLEYAQYYGWRRMAVDALRVYLDWPLLHGLLATAGLVSVAAWLAWRRGVLTRPARYFAVAALTIAAVTLITLPTMPFSAGNAMTFRSGLVHWDSMRYVALLFFVGWAALGLLSSSGGGPALLRSLVAALITSASLLASGSSWTLVIALALAAVALTMVQPRGLASSWPRPRRLIVAGSSALVLGGIVLGWHGAKTAATAVAIHREPLFGAAAAALDREPPGTRVAVFGDQWIYPALGDRGHLIPVRLDADGRVATEPIGGAMEPGEVTVDPATFGRNLRASGVTVVVLVRQPHPGRSPALPSQHAALERIADARLIHRDRAVAIWRLTIE
jgi:hypothetical protein